jgi:transcriptional regulator with XRE-family HTH domain
MKSKVAERMMAKIPAETKIFVDKYADIVVRVNQILKEKGITQKVLAEKLDKSPSEISKWLGGDHNFTLRSIARLEAELGETLLCVPRKKVFVQAGGGQRIPMTVHRSAFVSGVKFEQAKQVIIDNGTEKVTARAV